MLIASKNSFYPSHQGDKNPQCRYFTFVSASEIPAIYLRAQSISPAMAVNRLFLLFFQPVFCPKNTVRLPHPSKTCKRFFERIINNLFTAFRAVSWGGRRSNPQLPPCDENPEHYRGKTDPSAWCTWLWVLYS